MLKNLKTNYAKCTKSKQALNVLQVVYCIKLNFKLFIRYNLNYY